MNNSNMINNNPQNIMQPYVPPNIPRSRVHISVAPQSNELAQVVPMHVDYPNLNHTQKNVGS